MGVRLLYRNEVGMAEALRIVENRDHLRLDSEKADFVRFRHRKLCIFRVSLPKQVHGLPKFGRIDDRESLGRHGKAGDRHWVRDSWSWSADPIVPREVLRLLALRAA